MKITWKPHWYELDETIIVNDIDNYYLTADKKFFAHDSSDAKYETHAKINSIIHKQLGEIKGIITIGLDYTVYLSDGSNIIVNAEENPGECNIKPEINNWTFIVEIELYSIKQLEKSHFFVFDKYKFTQKKKHYKELLGINSADWEWIT